ncbi:secreted RxLR effector protein 78-like [Vicia villosa]|uniref:secreted RxLR effector protein 78-like n=1 Tax=Vicia villosa TaxID=3911 RepID=UPI00273C55DB|nr:secreted RxLR effector protein 78-like [Vicia villosa]
MAKREKRKCLALKIDFEKAFDRVSWSYLRYILRKMGFGDKWLKWMLACVFTSSVSVMINGGVTTDFSMEKGLRQGNPLSPFLFVMATEGLTRMVKRGTEIGDYSRFFVNDDVKVDIPQFADDTIILGNGFSMEGILPSGTAAGWDHNY